MLDFALDTDHDAQLACRRRERFPGGGESVAKKKAAKKKKK